MPEFQKELGAKDMSCPMPVMKTKKMLRDMVVGDILHVVATDPASVEDLIYCLNQLMIHLLIVRKAMMSIIFILRTLSFLAILIR